MPPDHERPTRRGLAFVAVFAVLLGLVAVQARRPVRPGVPYAAYDAPPPVAVAVVRSGRGYFTMNAPSHEFTYVVPMTSTTVWPVTVTQIRVDLPAGRVVVVAFVGDRSGEVDLMSDLVMFGQPWTVTLAGSLCSETSPSPSPSYR